MKFLFFLGGGGGAEGGGGRNRFMLQRRKTFNGNVTVCINVYRASICSKVIF